MGAGPPGPTRPRPAGRPPFQARLRRAVVSGQWSVVSKRDRRCDVVKIEDVPQWWIEGGRGHVLLGVAEQCSCGRCPRFEALCGRRGDAGEMTADRPAHPCLACLVELLTVRRADYT